MTFDYQVNLEKKYEFYLEQQIHYTRHPVAALKQKQNHPQQYHQEEEDHWVLI